jgi:penicillin G amidase
MRRFTGFLLVIALSAIPSFAQISMPSETLRLPGMSFPGTITWNQYGIPRIDAFTRNDAYFLQGYVHARDRLFQMDLSRRTAAGTLAEVVGDAGLPTDIQIRAIGLDRAANASLQAASPRAVEALEAYAAGVNAGIASQPLPPEYGALELTKVEPWTARSSVLVGKLIAFGLSFELGDIERTVALLTYQAAGQALGFDGTALFFEDLFRSAPFTSASTVPDALAASNSSGGLETHAATDEPILVKADIERAAAEIRPETMALAQQWLAELRESPFLGPILEDRFFYGSNMWAVHPSRSASGKALMANDPHLALDVPATFYPITLRAADMAVTGIGFPGVPFVVQGRNMNIAWGSTVNPTDVTDVYQETVVPAPGTPIGFGTRHGDATEMIFPYLQTFRKNNIGNGTKDDLTVVPPSATVPQATLVVPRRNAAIVQFDPAKGTALSVQYTGLYGTREIDAILIFNEAKNIEDFKRGIELFDFGAQNWSYQDVQGNIAYFTSGEVPIREDLQAGKVTGLPPYFIRNGAGGNSWIPSFAPSATRSTLAEILPFNEMPQIVNPPWFVNANNDPAGTTLDNNPLNQLRPGGGIFYLAPGYAGFRGGRATQMMRQKVENGSKATFDDMKQMQADVVMIDAQYFVPHILAALNNAKASSNNPFLAQLGAHPGVNAAVLRLANWDFSAPTGIPEGYDAADVNGQRSAPSQAEIDASIAATLYSVWRGQILKNTIDGTLTGGPVALPTPPHHQALTALKRLFDTFPQRGGHGASGVNFFNVTGVDDPAARRDIIVLKSLADSLALLASDAFKPAFNNSTDLNDYRWGKLHRIVFDHPLFGPFSIPPAGGAFPPPLAGLTGIPVDGGFEVVDASSHNARASTLNGFMFGSGPNRRYAGESGGGTIRSENVIPGGTSGNVTSSRYFNILPLWLTNDTYVEVLEPLPNRFPWGRR